METIVLNAGGFIITAYVDIIKNKKGRKKMKEIALGEIFTDKEVEKLQSIAVKKDKEKMLAFCKDREAKLKEKNIDGKYMYYALCYKFDMY